MYDSMFFWDFSPSESLYIFTIYLMMFDVKYLNWTKYIKLRNLYSLGIYGVSWMARVNYGLTWINYNPEWAI